MAPIMAFMGAVMKEEFVEEYHISRKTARHTGD
jgi:hypothetical protein